MHFCFLLPVFFCNKLQRYQYWHQSFGTRGQRFLASFPRHKILRWLVINYPPQKKCIVWYILRTHLFKKKTKDSHHQFAHEHTSKGPVRKATQLRSGRPRTQGWKQGLGHPGCRFFQSWSNKKHLKLSWIFVPPLKLTVRPKKIGWLEYQFPASLLGRFFGLFSGTKILVSGRVFCWEMSFLKGVQPHPSHLLWRLQPKASIAAANNGNDNFFDTGTWPSFSKTSHQKAWNLGFVKDEMDVLTNPYQKKRLKSS